MTQETLDFVKEKTVALIAAHSCSAEAKAAAEKWLAAVGTAKEAEEREITEQKERYEKISSAMRKKANKHKEV